MTEKCTPSEPQVSEQINILHAAIQSGADIADRLAERLNSILRDASPEYVKGDNNEPHKELVELACVLMDMNERATKTNDILNDILKRIEL